MRVVKVLLNRTPSALAYTGFDEDTMMLVMAEQEENA